MAVLVNPERTAMADALLQALSERGISAARTVPDAPDQIAAAVADALAEGADVIAAIGGDGTQRTVADALRGTDGVLAVVPGGTVNLLGQVLDIHDAEDAADAIAEGTPRTLDMGEVDGHPFILNASSGYDAAVIGQVDDDGKRFGRLAYLAVGVATLRRHRPRTVVVTVDGAVGYRGRAMGVIVLNVGQRASADFVLAPDADPADGRLDVVVQRADTPSALGRAAVALARGQRPSPDDLVLLQGAEVEVVWDVAMDAQRDGDPLEARRRLRHRAVPGALRVLQPPG